MKDICEINKTLFSFSSEEELVRENQDIIFNINKESEYDFSGEVPFLPLSRLNSLQERGLFKYYL